MNGKSWKVEILKDLLNEVISKYNHLDSKHLFKDKWWQLFKIRKMFPREVQRYFHYYRCVFLKWKKAVWVVMGNINKYSDFTEVINQLKRTPCRHCHQTQMIKRITPIQNHDFGELHLKKAPFSRSKKSDLFKCGLVIV